MQPVRAAATNSAVAARTACFKLRFRLLMIVMADELASPRRLLASNPGFQIDVEPVPAGPGPASVLRRRVTVVHVSEPTRPPAEGQPSEDEVREYLKQLRSAPAEQVVADIVFGLVNAAQAKLGRRDARLLIDLTSTVMEQTRAHLSAELVTEIDQVIGQLRLSQVQAESRLSAINQHEPNDLAEMPAPPSPAAQQPAGRPQPPPSKLWVPGRDF